MYFVLQFLAPSPSGRVSRDRCLPLMLTLLLFAVSTSARGVTPAPDGGYPSQNTAEGDFALLKLTDGTNNTAIGFQSLLNNTGGNSNTAIGSFALHDNISGIDNTATGFSALSSNKTGNGNTANGVNALINNDADNNTAAGFEALFSNSTGFNNTATGVDALQNNTTGNFNTADGDSALFSNKTASRNTANGVSALFFNTTGFQNTATGALALSNNVSGSNNTVDGFQALLRNTGSNNIGLGSNAGINLTTGNNNIDIGAPGTTGEANTIRIGKQGTQKATLIAGISGTAVTGSTVVVNSTGKLGVASSSARFKEAIRPMGKSSEAILALKPVTFRYKEEVDPDRTAQFGLVAEEVEKVDSELVIHDEQGKPFTVHYEAVNAMLLNEFLKEHRKVEELEKQIKALTATVQKVSDQLELNKTDARRIVGD